MDRMKNCFRRFSFAGCQKYFFDNLRHGKSMPFCEQSEPQYFPTRLISSMMIFIFSRDTLLGIE